MEVKSIRIILIPNVMDCNTSMDDFMHGLSILNFWGDDVKTTNLVENVEEIN